MIAMLAATQWQAALVTLGTQDNIGTEHSNSFGPASRAWPPIIRPDTLFTAAAANDTVRLRAERNSTDQDTTMPWFKRDPRKRLQKAYAQKLKLAMEAMHRGDIRQNAFLTSEAEEIKAELDKLDTAD